MNKKVLSLSMALMLGLAGCSSSTSTPTASAEPSKYVAGTYTASAAGRMGDVTVEVVFSDNAIESVTVGENSETPAYAEAAIESIPAAIVDTQSTNVDTVTNATMTSVAIIDAVKDCILQAGGTIDDETSGAVVSREEVTVDTDVLVIGGGMAGMVAAMAAKDAGVDVTLIEKASTLGGTVTVAGGYLIAVNSETYADAGVDDSLEAFQKAWNEHMAYSGVDSGYPDWDRLNLTLADTGATVDYLAENGVTWGEEPFLGFDGGTYVVAANPNGGSGLVSEMVAALENKEVNIVTGMNATELLTDADGNVIGALAESSDTITTYNAKAVILATGGYANNEEMLAKWAPKLAAVDTVSGAVASATGDGFIMAEAVGAAFFEDGTGFGSLWTTQVEPDALAAAPELAGLNFGPTLGVNGTGERFAAETPNVPYVDALASDMIQDGSAPFFYIFDSSDADSVAILEAGVDAGAVKKADTIEALAAEIGVNAEALQATYDAYNAMAATGTDTQFGKADELVVELTEAPFYAVQRVPSTFGSTGGVLTDEEQHVLNTDGEIIGGLFAAGEMSNRYYYNENYMLAGSLGLYGTAGRVAGTVAAVEAAE